MLKFLDQLNEDFITGSLNAFNFSINSWWNVTLPIRINDKPCARCSEKTQSAVCVTTWLGGHRSGWRWGTVSERQSKPVICCLVTPRYILPDQIYLSSNSTLGLCVTGKLVGGSCYWTWGLGGNLNRYLNDLYYFHFLQIICTRF